MFCRFLQVTHQKFVPSSNIDGRTIEFLLDRYDAANVILIQVFVTAIVKYFLNLLLFSNIQKLGHTIKYQSTSYFCYCSNHFLLIHFAYCYSSIGIKACLILTIVFTVIF